VLVDNASSYDVPGAEEIELGGQKALKMSHLTILFLPATVTSHVQPLDQGIIRSFKGRARKILMRWRLALYEQALRPGNNINVKGCKPTERDMVLWISSAWQEVPNTVIGNCWKHAVILPATWAAALNGTDQTDAQRFEAAEVEDMALLVGQLQAADATDSPAAAKAAADAALPAEGVTLADAEDPDGGEPTEGEVSMLDVLLDVVSELAEKDAEVLEDQAEEPEYLPVTVAEGLAAFSMVITFMTDYPDVYSADEVAMLQKLQAKAQQLQAARRRRQSNNWGIPQASSSSSRC